MDVDLLSEKTPLISIIVPAYNIAEYIGDCLKSLIAQTYPNLEIIVIDDGSTDETNAIIAAHQEQDQRIKLIRQANQGVSAARNHGLDSANGEYIGFCDGDDYVDAEMYKVLVQNILNNHADIAQCGFQMEFPDRVYHYYGTGKKYFLNHEKAMLHYLKADLIEPSLWNKLYARALWDEIRFDSELKYNEDVLINYYLFKKSQRFVFEDIEHYHYRMRPNSATKNRTDEKKILDPLKVLKTIVEDCRKDSEAWPFAYKRYLGVLARDVQTSGARIHGLDTLSLLRSELKDKEGFNKLSSKRFRWHMALTAQMPRTMRGVRKTYNSLTKRHKYFDID